MVAGTNLLSILFDILMIWGLEHLKVDIGDLSTQLMPIFFFALPAIVKIVRQIAFWLCPVLWQPIIPYHKLIMELLGQ